MRKPRAAKQNGGILNWGPCVRVEGQGKAWSLGAFDPPEGDHDKVSMTTGHLNGKLNLAVCFR